MKINSYLYVLLLVISVSCIDSYDFTISDGDDGIVIESFISNISYTESLDFPSDGRYFEVILHYTSDVVNVYDEYISDATVQLKDSNGNIWQYTKSESDEGYYYLCNDDFKASFGTKYQLQVNLADGSVVSSEWCSMPMEQTEVNDLYYEETIVEKYKSTSNDEIILSYEGINVYLNSPVNTDGSTMRYKWSFDPLWTYEAPYSYESQTGYRCWVTNPNYLSGYTLYEGTKSEVTNELFFLETTGNERIYEYFSVLIDQQVVNEGYYNFYSDLKAQNSRGGLFEEPPFSLTTNYTSDNSKINVSGYFDVVTENAIRWVFDKNELSYDVENDLMEECDSHTCPGGPCPPKACSDCRYYIHGDAVITPPAWWPN